MYSNILWLYKVAKFDMNGNFAHREIQTDLLVEHSYVLEQAPLTSTFITSSIELHTHVMI